MSHQQGEASESDAEPRLIPLTDMAEPQKGPTTIWLAIMAILIGLAATVATGSDEAETFVLLTMLAIGVGLMARSMATALDGKWLPNLIVWAWIVKMMASAGRYLALQLLYGGSGDATGYHGSGVRNAALWRSFDPPDLGSETEFVQAVTGLIYAPYTPTMLGGFFIFATLAFIGQVLLYAAFRRAFPSPRVKWYAALIFFFPNILYWPSSIGKESLMLLFIGIGAYASVRLFSDYGLRWLLLLGLALAGSGVIRSHIALLLAFSVVGVMALGRGPGRASGRTKRVLSLTVLLLMTVIVVRHAVADFGIDISGGVNESLLEEEIDPIFATVEGQTDKGGSAVEGTAIRSPRDIPEAVIRVVFRPLPTDAHNPQALANSIVEGLFLLLLFIWRSPAIARNLFRHWRDPYILFSLLYTGGFVFGHSAVLNLGIIARQRSQAIPFILVLLVELGKRPEESSEHPSTTASEAATTQSEIPPWPVTTERVRMPSHELGRVGSS